MKRTSFESYFTSSNYLSFTLKNLRQGGLWRSVSNIYKRIRKYTVISTAIRITSLVMLLLEKSAVFLLMASALILLLPIILFVLLLYSAVSAAKFLKHRKEIRLWISDAERITVYLTNEKIFTEKPKLFLRAASFEASEYSHPVIVLCSDRIISLKWYGINLLGIRPECFFAIKNRFLSKSESIINYIIIN